MLEDTQTAEEGACTEAPAAPATCPICGSQSPLSDTTACPHIVPMMNRVLVRLIEQEERRFGSLILPPQHDASQKYRLAEIVAVGPGRVSEYGVQMTMSPQLQPGRRLMLSVHGGTDFVIDKHKFIIVMDHEVLAVLPCAA